MALSVTAWRGSVETDLMQMSVALLLEAPSGPAKPGLVDLVPTRESPAVVLHPESDAHNILDF